jgi:4-hydroxy-2-oxoheptanedioate aldolase
MFRTNFLKEKLSAGAMVIGTWSVVPSVIVADIIASSGLDFLIIDSEHGPVSFEMAQNMVIACESRGVSPVMRVGGVIEAEVLRALDIGAHCLQVPNITQKEEINKLVTYAKYPPVGNRGFSPFTRAGNYSLERAKELTGVANAGVLLAVQIEGKEAIDNVEEIVKMDHVDIIFIGLFDISKSMGVPGEVDHPMVIKTLTGLIKSITNAGKYPGTIVTDMAQLQHCVDLGVKYITYSVDCEVLGKAYKNIERAFRELASRKV